MTIRDNVKALCKLQNITQKQLAEKLGITDSSLNISLKADRKSRFETIKRIADALGVTVDRLVSDDPTGMEQPAKPAVVYVPYLRCPHCGKKIEVFVKAMDGEQAESSEQ